MSLLKTCVDMFKYTHAFLLLYLFTFFHFLIGKSVNKNRKSSFYRQRAYFCKFRIKYDFEPFKDVTEIMDNFYNKHVLFQVIMLQKATLYCTLQYLQ